MMNPFFSIGIPVYNGEKYILSTIKAIQNQNYDDFEVVCVDDGSNDGTLALLESLSLADKRIKVFKNEINSGIAVTRDKVVSYATGKFFLWCDSDDILNPGALATLAQFFENKSNEETVVIQNAIIDNAGKRTALYKQNVPKSYDPELISKRVLVSNGFYSFPWTIIGKRDFFLNIHYPQNAKQYVDDQLVSYRYFDSASRVYFSPQKNYTHYIRSGSDCHSPSFYLRLYNTYKYLNENVDLRYADVCGALELMSYLNLAFYYSFSKDETNTYGKVKSIAKLIRTTKHCLRHVTKLESKNRVLVLVLAYCPLIFYKHYSTLNIYG